MTSRVSSSRNAATPFDTDVSDTLTIDTHSILRRGSLSDVPEEEPTSPTGSFTPSSPVYNNAAASNSASTFGGALNSTSSPSPSTTPTSTTPRAPIGPRKPANLRNVARSSDAISLSGIQASSSSSSSAKRSNNAATNTPSQSRSGSTVHTRSNGPIIPRKRSNPRLPHDKEAPLVASTVQHWSKAPVWGTLPRSMRAHTLTLVDTTAWVFGGNEDKDKEKDNMYCFDIETMQWTRPETVGDLPPPCRAHTATLVDRKIVIICGGLGGNYFDSVYIFDTIMRRWSRPSILPGPRPIARRAHSAVLYKDKIWVFGGGSGMRALNDTWILDVSGLNSGRPLRWEEVPTLGKKPRGRGYHSANLVGKMMVIIGGSDGNECFKDISCLNLDSLQWMTFEQEEKHGRLAHSATQVGSTLYILGGHSGGNSEYRNDLSLFNLVSLEYETRVVLGNPPSRRGHHAAVVADSRLFLFGGFNGSYSMDDVHILELAASAYLPQVRTFKFGDGHAS